MEKAAPTVSYSGTKARNEAKNVTTWSIPTKIKDLDLFKLLSFEIIFIVKDEGIIPNASINRTNSPET